MYTIGPINYDISGDGTFTPLTDAVKGSAATDLLDG